MKTLAGDRGVEWKWAMDHLLVGKGWVLDFGPMVFNLSAHAVLKGYNVVAVGLEDLGVPPKNEISYFREDILAFETDIRFDYILNTSTTEHVGLGRYGDAIGKDCDLLAMALLKKWMKPDARHILTVPIGRDAVVEHWHRVYGPERLPLLLSGYYVLEEMFWVKSDDDTTWISCSKEQAFEEVPVMPPVDNMIQLCYALGGFLLCLE